ncbi:uncharacterized protein ACNLHF_003086 [Anomaloglossus baeobatrachus]|uniref:uncharacterized protein LOC142256726 n=1 Tax=Anomaloglossus baeobatrachus TaxID=238106 RepID=UPI003F50632A
MAKTSELSQDICSLVVGKCTKGIGYRIFKLLKVSSIYRIPVYRQQNEQKRIREDAQPSTMKNLVAFLCMIAVIIVPIFSDKCKSCDSDQLPCKETDIECNSRGCMTSFSTIHAKGRVYYKLRKGCATDPVCAMNKKTNVCGEVQKESRFCCYKNLCKGFGSFSIAEDGHEYERVQKLPLNLDNMPIKRNIEAFLAKKLKQIHMA